MNIMQTLNIISLIMFLICVFLGYRLFKIKQRQDQEANQSAIINREGENDVVNSRPKKTTFELIMEILINKRKKQ